MISSALNSRLMTALGVLVGAFLGPDNWVTWLVAGMFAGAGLAALRGKA